MKRGIEHFFKKESEAGIKKMKTVSSESTPVIPAVQDIKENIISNVVPQTSK
jgi:hypothetical protein